MKPHARLHLLSGTVLLFNPWRVGHYSIDGIPVVVMTLGFAIAHNYIAVAAAKCVQ